MSKPILFPVFLVLAFLFLFSSCSEEEKDSMILRLVPGSGLTTQDTLVNLGDTLKVRFEASFNGSDPLESFLIKGNGQVVGDSNFSANIFQVELFLIKGVPETDHWVFEITDASGSTDSLVLNISRNTGINSVASIKLGAQDNTQFPSFYSSSNNTTYFQAEAFNHQNEIDLFCFYENTASHQNFMTLAAPGSNITGIFSGPSSPEAYSVKNTTYFVKTSISAAQYEAISDDLAMIALFDPANQYKKAKNLQAGEVYSLRFQDGRYGLLKVLAVEGVENGSLEFSLKVQQ